VKRPVVEWKGGRNEACDKLLSPTKTYLREVPFQPDTFSGPDRIILRLAFQVRIARI